MLYTLEASVSRPQLLQITIQLQASSSPMQLQLPAWRPGRYELQNFAKNIVRFSVSTANGSLIRHRKLTKDLWEIPAHNEPVTVTILYHAVQQDAGGSYLSDQVFYLNFVNCLPYLVGSIHKPAQVQISLPKPMQYVCALAKTTPKPTAKVLLKASSMYKLYDSPFIAAVNVQSVQYQVGIYQFYIHFVGNYSPNWPVLKPQFEAFTALQIQLMGAFPEPQYHFIHYILPSAYYHGVEHAASTMLVLGPDTDGPLLHPDILGVCSHELFHAWNICKIRPAELLPYNYTSPSYFDTGFVVEGITTYLGDLLLLHSGVINKETYLTELNALCIKHFDKNEPAGQSLAESSIDLWIDGYSNGTPGKKVSIYNKGALAALILDIIIRRQHQHQRSLYTLMQQMWLQYGQTNTGYTMAGFKAVAEQVMGQSLDKFFDHCVYSNKAMLPYLNKELAHIGLKLNHTQKNYSLQQSPELSLFAQKFFEKLPLNTINIS
jgi:predicted metalloprotease with PDZ domain